MEEDEDNDRSEATFRFTVPDFSGLQGVARSKPIFVRNLPWKIIVMSRTNFRQNKPSIRSLGFYLQCNGESKSTTWSCKAVAELRLISKKKGVETVSKKIEHLFCSKQKDWGFSHYMPWEDVLNPRKGFIKGDAITLEVSVTADEPDGVSDDEEEHSESSSSSPEHTPNKYLTSLNLNTQNQPLKRLKTYYLNAKSRR